MKIVYNKIIPFQGYKAINLFGILFVRSGATLDNEDINHEAIHTEQMKDFCSITVIGAIPFYIVYGVLFLYYWIKGGFKDAHSAYKSIPFEQEAYANEDNLDYISTRESFAWTDYM